MTLEEFRSEMESYRQDAIKEAAYKKDQYVLEKHLTRLYRRFDADERVMADQVISDWALSEDYNVRFDALVLINEFKIASAIPSLRRLTERLEPERTPYAQFELKRVTKIIAEVTR